VAAPELSAVVVLGPVRDRAQRVVDAICDQTAAERMEIVLVDAADEATPRLRTHGPAAVVYLRRPPPTTWGAARAAGLDAANAPAVAFLEDHCFPSPDWAEALVDAHRERWAAVGYAFGNANPASYVSRASFVVDYGTWAEPTVSGETGLLQSNNISYKRELLEAIGQPLDELLETDWNVQQALKAEGHRLYLEGRAIAFHHNFTSVREMLDENFAHCRAIAAGRREREDWGRLRSAAQALATPVVAPPIRLARLVRRVAARPGQRAAVVRALPLIALVYPYAAIGEAIGYAWGLGATDRALRRSLLDTQRESAPPA
jgi:Glycosyl transferase family 2